MNGGPWGELSQGYRVELLVAGKKDWHCNGMRFATAEQAEQYALELAGRWMLVKDWRVTRMDNEGE
jgi:hypothetical protein